MNIEKPYPIVKPTETAIDYSQCYLPFFESKHDGYMYYHDKVVSLEEAYELRLMGFSEPTHMAWYLESKMFKLHSENHNTSNVKISLPTREQADCFLNGR